jgi:hypothetical protein
MGRRTGFGVLIALLLAAAPFLAAAPQASGSGESGGTVTASGSHWKYYALHFEFQGAPYGDDGARRQASVPFFGAALDMEALRTNQDSGSQFGGREASGYSITGLVVLNPKPGYSYSWKASCSLDHTSLEAKVDCGLRGNTAGCAHGSVEMRMYGDLRWRIRRDASAHDDLGGSLQISWPPAYTPNWVGERIEAHKKEHVVPLFVQTSSSGGDGHVQVRYRGRVHADVLAASQWGLDARYAQSTVYLDGAPWLTLKGFSKPPAPPPGPEGSPGTPTPPLLDALLNTDAGWVSPDLGIEPCVPPGTEDGSPEPDIPEGRDEKDFENEDW